MLSSFVEFDPAPSATAHRLMAASEKRLGITFLAPATGRVTLSTEPGVTDGNGLVLTAGQAPLELWLRHHGDAVQREWYGIYTAGATAASWVQVLG